MDIKKLNAGIAKAQELMLNEEFNTLVDKYAKNRGGNFDTSDLTMLESKAFGSPTTVTPQRSSVQESVRKDNGNLNYNNLPEFIRESFIQQPPIVDESDSAPLNPLDAIAENLSVKHNNMMESRETKPAQPQLYNGVGNVDYSLIKMIVKECVKEALSENTKTLTGIRLGENGKIQLLDNKGYLYEGVLEKKRKVVKKNK